MSGLLDFLVEWRVPLLIALAVMAVLAIGYLVRTVRRSRSSEKEEAPGPSETVASAVASLARVAELEVSFLAALRALRSVSPGGLATYRQPWYLALGPVGSGTSSVLEQVPLARRVQPDLGGDGEGRASVGWHFFDEGIVLDVHGDLVQRADLDSDETTWKRLLSLLRRHRADRPIDGVILTLPAPRLVEWRRRPAEELREVGASLFRKLQEAQTALGVRFPVYVVLTRANELPGFSSFAQAVPRRFHQDPFGWSSPYALDTVFRREWVDEAMASIGDTARSRSMELLGAREFSPESDTLFRFPEVMQWLLPASREILGEVFEDSAYHEAFFLRGIYLTGRVEVEDAPSTPPEDDGEEVADAPIVERSAFLGRLFTRKIFPERGLARTFRQGLLARNRQVRALQIAAILILLLGPTALWYGHGSLSVRTTELDILLDSVGANLERIRGGRGAATTLSEEESQVDRLLRQMASVEGGPTSVFFPTSWLAGLDDEVAANITQAFPTVILPTLREGITTWPDTLVENRDWLADLGGQVPPEPREGAIVSSERFREYELLVGYLSEIGQFAAAAQRYNRLGHPEANPTREFEPLYEWYYVRTLPNEVSGHAEALFNEVLAGAASNPVTVDDLRPGFEPEAAEVAAGLVGRFYERLTATVRSLETGLEGTDDDSYSSADLRELYRDVREVEAVLNSADSTWLMAGSGTMVQALRLRLDSIPETPLVDAELFRREFTRGFEAQRSAALAAVEAELDVLAEVLPSVELAQGRSLRRELGPALERIRTSLEELVARDFMKPAVRRSGSRSRSGMPSWNFTRLDETLAWFAEYQSYREGPLQEVPGGLRARIDAAAGSALAERVRASLAGALVFEPVDPAVAFDGVEAELVRRLTDFDQAARRLGGMLQIDAELGTTRAGVAVAETILLEASDLLADLDLLLAESRVFRQAGVDLSAWEGERPVWSAAYGPTTPDGLEEYVTAQTARLEELASHGRAILAYLDLPPVRKLLDREGSIFAPETVILERRWRGIIAQFDDHANGVAGNSLDVLLRFIREGMAVEEVTGCVEVGWPEERAGDWYLQIREDLTRQLIEQCTQLARRALLEGYDEVRTFHAERLQGRFPFVGPEDAASAPAAEIEAVRQFVERWSEVVAPLRGRGPELVESLLEDEIDPVVFARLDASAAFLSRLFFTELEGGVPGIDVRPAFRSPREGERGGDQVVDWELEIAGQRRSYRGRSSDPSLQWRIGDPVRATLVWASESDRRPATMGDRLDLEVDDARATFRYEGPWALLRLLAVNRPDDRVLRGAPSEIAGTVALELLTRSADARMESPDSGEAGARLFLRLELRGEDGIFGAPFPLFPASLPAR